MRNDYYQRSYDLHRKSAGKICVNLKVEVNNSDDLSLVYTPGVARPCQAIHENPQEAWNLTIKGNTVAVITDGSAVLGLGNIGPLAAMPVMEGKSALFKKFANIDAFPICLDTQDTEELIKTIRHLAPTFGGINLEDIAAPRCFEIERRLQDLGIPVFHDDQHGTAIAVLAAMINASRLSSKAMQDLKVVICGAGAAGTAIARLLAGIDYPDGTFPAVKDIILCDSKGAVSDSRKDLSDEKRELLEFTNLNHAQGSLQDVLKGADVFIGVSKGNLLNQDDIRSMADSPWIFAMANPTPEIMPEDAYDAGAGIVATGRSDLPNQINNALVFPGIFRGALDAGATCITPKMKLAAAQALADSVVDLSRDKIIPHVLDPHVCAVVAKAVVDSVEPVSPECLVN
ncbi:MAG: NADP-dependent malic enzyme [Parachlamydiales bacterium]|nr:NADP-dependent malic enzyme [Parachlamydiales bacterium]